LKTAALVCSIAVFSGNSLEVVTPTGLEPVLPP
jgi:hypothetical protein